MALPRNAGIPDSVCDVVNDAPFEHHPFKSSSISLRDFVRAASIIRQLPPPLLAECVREIETNVNRVQLCTSCYGKGLAYLMFITDGLLPEEYKRFYERYQQLRTARPERDFQRELARIFNWHGISMSAAHQG